MSKRGTRKIRHLVSFDRSSLPVTYHFCALVDILQQGQRLREISQLDLATQREEIGERLAETWGVVENLRESFETMRHGALKPTGPPSAKISKNQWAQIKKFQLHTMSFSDLVCVFGSLDNTYDNLPIWGLWHALSATASHMLMYLSARNPLRGGIAISTGWEIQRPIGLPERKFKMGTCRFHRELYGPALCLAHDLESKSAEYPRVVVGEEVLDYIHRGHEEFPDWRQPIFQLAANLCQQLLCRDTDGLLILDYLGAGHKEQILHSSPQLESDLFSMFKQAHRFVLEQQIHFREKAERASDRDLLTDARRLVDRYDALAAYFAASKDAWS